MKIILKITMICGLLLSVLGTVEGARKYAPGVAMRMALKGDFDQSESEQILAAIPEEWKKEHRAIVRQMIQGTRGRPAKGKKPLKKEGSSEEELSTDSIETDELKDLLDEPKGEDIFNNDSKSEVVEDTKKESVKEDDKKSNNESILDQSIPPLKESNQSSLFNDMNIKLNRFMEAAYQYTDTNKKIAVIDAIGDLSVNPYYIIKDNYIFDYGLVIGYFNSFIKKVAIAEELVKEKPNANQTAFAIQKALSKCKSLIDTMEEKKYSQESCLPIVNTLAAWFDDRMVAQLKQSNIFTKNVDKTIKEFNGGKESMPYLLKEMNKKLISFSNDTYMLDNKSDVKSVNIPDKDDCYYINLDSYIEDFSPSIGLFNAFINGLIYCESLIKEKNKNFNIVITNPINACLRSSIMLLQSIPISDKNDVSELNKKLQYFYDKRLQKYIGYSGESFDQEKSRVNDNYGLTKEGLDILNLLLLMKDNLDTLIKKRYEEMGSFWTTHIRPNEKFKIGIFQFKVSVGSIYSKNYSELIEAFNKFIDNIENDTSDLDPEQSSINDNIKIVLSNGNKFLKELNDLIISTDKNIDSVRLKIGEILQKWYNLRIEDYVNKKNIYDVTAFKNLLDISNKSKNTI